MTGNIKTHPFFKTINWTLLEKRQVEPPFKPKVVCDPASFRRGHPAAFGVGTSFALPLSCVIRMLSPLLLPANLLPRTFSHRLYPDSLPSLPSLSHPANTGNSGSSHPFTYVS